MANDKMDELLERLKATADKQDELLGKIRTLKVRDKRLQKLDAIAYRLADWLMWGFGAADTDPHFSELPLEVMGAHRFAPPPGVEGEIENIELDEIGEVTGGAEVFRFRLSNTWYTARVVIEEG